MTTKHQFTLAVLLTASLALPAFSQTSSFDQLASLPFKENRPTKETAQTLRDELLPPNIPTANSWSLTLYEAENASGLANGQPFPSLGSRDKPAQNADGSTDLHLRPKAPAGKESNWLATVPGRGTEAAIDKSWKPGDIERVK